MCLLLWEKTTSALRASGGKSISSFRVLGEDVTFQLRTKGHVGVSQAKLRMEGHPAFPSIHKKGREGGNKITYLVGIVLFIT